VQAYTLAEKALRSDEHREAIVRFRGDHERHIEELTRLIEHRGGRAAPLPHLSSSPFKLAAQGLGDLGSDTAVLLAFKSNERLSRDKYQRAANAGYPADVQTVVQRAADDESAHYIWAQETLEQLGAGEDTTAGKAERVFEAGHAKLADVMEAGEKRVMQGAGAARAKLTEVGGSATTRVNELAERLGRGGLQSVLVAVGVGVVAAQLLGRSGGRSGGSAAFNPGHGGSTGSARPTRSRGERSAFDDPSYPSQDTGMPVL
jgi:rubrerythrin